MEIQKKEIYINLYKFVDFGLLVNALSECPNGIASGTIKYGRWDNTICPHGTVGPNTAPVFKEYPLTAGITSIPGAINTFVKDDPLYGTAKHYEASYIC